MSARICAGWLLCLTAVGCIGGQTGTPTSGGVDGGCFGKPLAQEARDPLLPSYEGTYTLVGTRNVGGSAGSSDGDAQGEPITLTLRIEGAVEGQPLPARPVPTSLCTEDDFTPVHVSLVSSDGTLELDTSAWIGRSGEGAALWIVAHEDGSPFDDSGNQLSPVFGSVSLSEGAALLTLLFRAEELADNVHIQARGAH